MIKIHEVKVIFEPRDLWVGLYWDRSVLPSGNFGVYVLYFCIVPMLPIRIKILKRKSHIAPGNILVKSYIYGIDDQKVTDEDE